jgi:hypothetical protein
MQIKQDLTKSDKLIPNQIRKRFDDDLLSDVALDFNMKTWTWTARFDTSATRDEIEARFADIREGLAWLNSPCGPEDDADPVATDYQLKYQVSKWSAARQRKATSDDMYHVQRMSYEYKKFIKAQMVSSPSNGLLCQVAFRTLN